MSGGNRLPISLAALHTEGDDKVEHVAASLVLERHVLRIDCLQLLREGRFTLNFRQLGFPVFLPLDQSRLAFLRLRGLNLVGRGHRWVLLVQF